MSLINVIMCKALTVVYKERPMHCLKEHKQIIHINMTMQQAILEKKHSNISPMQSAVSVHDILLYDDDQRLDNLVNIFAKYHMAGKRYEARAWPVYFRRIASNPIVFYQYNATLFYEDIQYESEQFEVVEPTFIHGNLHVGQFDYYDDEVSSERFFNLRHYKKIVAPFTWDLKRLAASLALIAYCQGFSDVEIGEILNGFTQQYIDSVLLPSKVALVRIRSNEVAQPRKSTRPSFNTQHSVIGSSKIQRKMHEIDWQSIDSIVKLMALAGKLAVIIAGQHCQPPSTIFPLKDVQYLLMANNEGRCAQVIQTALSSAINQQKLIDEIRAFATNYAKIAERDHRLFFKHFRSVRMFEGINTLKNSEIPHPLAHARRVAILIVGGGIGGMATALCFARAGIRVRLLEKCTDFGELGAGMQLAPNCSRILHQLGILKQIQVNAVFPKQIVWMDAMSGERLACIDLGDKFVENFAYPYMVVHRGDLFHALYQACMASSLVSMESNRTVTSVDERPKSVMVECADGMRYDCDMVVAADGLWSSLRKFVHDDGAPISVGYVTYRGTVSIDKVSKEAGLENVQFWIGPNMHLVQYPIRRGELFNQAAVFKSNRQPDDTDQWGTKEELNERFSVGCEHVKSALELLQTNIRWPVYE
jgi:hypothetical protein